MNLRADQEAWVVERILDAAGEQFAADGVLAVGMAEVAAAAGVSRATLYRYVESRHALRVAYVHRETRRLGDRIAEQVSAIDDPVERLVAAVLFAVEQVRTTPTLAAWFSGPNAAVALDLADSSQVIEALAVGFVAGDDEVDQTIRERAGWTVRIVLSLLTLPAPDATTERRLVEQYLAPVVI